MSLNSQSATGIVIVAITMQNVTMTVATARRKKVLEVNSWITNNS